MAINEIQFMYWNLIFLGCILWITLMHFLYVLFFSKKKGHPTHTHVPQESHHLQESMPPPPDPEPVQAEPKIKYVEKAEEPEETEEERIARLVREGIEAAMPKNETQKKPKKKKAKSRKKEDDEDDDDI